MNAYLYQLRFETPVHFGASDSALSLYTSEDHFCADTLFSALCHTASAMGGPEAASALCEEARQGNLLLSDSMPWSHESGETDEDTFYLPRPMMLSESEFPPELLKAMKKQKWLPVSAMDAFLSSLHGIADFDPLSIPMEFGKSGVTERAAIPREEGTDAEPYPVGFYQFHPDCGLYFIALFQNETQEHPFRRFLTVLGLSGIGGKSASGYGKFSLQSAVDLSSRSNIQFSWIWDALCREDSSSQLLLTSSLPHNDELEAVLDGAGFQMIRRAGFVQPASPEEQGAKKKTQYFLSAGSVLRRRFSGAVYAVRKDGGSPVVRFSRPVLLGLPQGVTAV